MTLPLDPLPEPYTAETTRHTIAAYFAATRAMDPDAFVATFAADAVLEDPVGTPVVQGHDAIRHAFARIIAALPTFGITEERVMVQGHRGAAAWLGHGVRANGQVVSFVGIDVFTLNAAGVIQQMQSYWDADVLLAQLSRTTPATPPQEDSP